MADWRGETRRRAAFPASEASYGPRQLVQSDQGASWCLPKARGGRNRGAGVPMARTGGGAGRSSRRRVLEGCAGLLNSLDRLGRGLRGRHWGQGDPRCSNGVKSPWRSISPAAVCGWKSGADAARSGAKELEEDPGAQANVLRGSLASVVRWGGVRTAVQRSGGTAEQGARCARVLEVALVDRRGQRVRRGGLKGAGPRISGSGLGKGGCGDHGEVSGFCCASTSRGRWS